MKTRVYRGVGIYALMVLTLWGATACRSARRTEPLVGPIPLNTPELRLGRQSFDTHCHPCHPNGGGGLGPGLNDKPLPGFLVTFQVRHGLGVMPGFNKEQISEAELRSIVAYMKHLRGQK